MNAPFIITQRVINTIKSLRPADREPITKALSMEFILGENPESTLTPIQNVIYAMIRFYVQQDAERSEAIQSASKPCGLPLCGVS